MATILLTGRNGFVGRALVSRLKLNHRFVSVIRRKENGIDYAKEDLIIKDLCKLTIDDVKSRGVDVVIHLAAQLRGRPTDIYRNNVESSTVTFRVAESLGAPVIFSSSVNALFDDDLGSYARSKRDSERVLQASRVDFVIVRVPLVIGPGSRPLEKVRSFYSTWRFFPLLGRQTGLVQPIHVDDFTLWIEKHLNTQSWGQEETNLVGKEEYTYRDVIAEIVERGKQARFVSVPIQLVLCVTRFAEATKLPFPVTSEEVRSVNANKLLPLSDVTKVDNNRSRLFASNRF